MNIILLNTKIHFRAYIVARRKHENDKCARARADIIMQMARCYAVCGGGDTAQTM